MSLSAGFDPQESRELLALCAIINDNAKHTNPPQPVPPFPKNPAEYPGWPGLPGGIAIPPGWGDKALYSPPVAVALDNFGQIWAKTNDQGQTEALAVVLQGTQSNLPSEAEDAIAFMLPATGSASINGASHSYKLADDDRAAVQAGWTYGVISLMEKAGLFQALADATDSGANTELPVYITGHSMGAALATLCRSYLAYNRPGNIDLSRLNYKTYVYAQPKPGNDVYSLDFQRLSSVDNQGNKSSLGIRVTNTHDWVPQVPLTRQHLHDLNTPNILSVFNRKHPWIKRLAKFIDFLERRAAHSIARKFQKVIKEVTGDDVKFNLAPTLDFRSAATQNIVLAGIPAQGPKELADRMWEHHATMYYVLQQQQYPAA